MRKHRKYLWIIILLAVLFGTKIFGKVVHIVTDTAFSVVRGTTEIVERIASGKAQLAEQFSFEDGTLIFGGYPIRIGEQSEEIFGGFADKMTDVSEGGFTAKRYTFAAKDHRDLDIDVSGCGIVIAPGETDEITVEVLESETFTYAFSTVDGALKIRDSVTDANPPRSFFGIRIPNAKKQVQYTGLSMMIGVPADFDGEISLRTTAGDVILGGLSLSEELTVTTSAGDIELSAISAEEIEAETSGGRITLADLAAKEIDALTSGGRISMSNLTSKRLLAQTSAASIDCVRLFGEKFELYTTDGDISGSIIGSESLFTIETETDGRAIPESRENSRSQYLLTARTVDGDINIRFVD